MDVGQPQYRIREVGVAPAPIVHDLRTTDTEAAGDLGCVDQVIDVDLPSHRYNRTDGTRQLRGAVRRP